ncbi:MAG: outer membrane beta-barrel protein [Bacteroidia bacterium]|nr:outer membrane beta-barrel protein [Bacteroidia bacterium]
MKKFKFVILGAIICFNFGTLFSQTEKKSLIKPFGIGLHIEQFKLNDITDLANSPANKIILSISPSRSFRLEPELGLRFAKDQNSDNSSNCVYMGLGALGMFQRNNLNLYAGLRFEYGMINVNSKDYNGAKRTDETNRVTLGPVLGAEYYLGENFTFGGEVGFRYVSIGSTVSPKPTGYEDSKTSNFSTDTGLFVRFYF